MVEYFIKYFINLNIFKFLYDEYFLKYYFKYLI